MLGRLLLLGLVPALGVLGSPPQKSPRQPEIRATMACRVDAGTGRLVCAVELAPPAGHALTWSDALVVRAPPRARPLRARVSGSGRPPRRIELGFVLGPGEGGRIEVLARGVTCAVERASDCRTSSARVAFDVQGS
jgi:hypothetical protein